MASFINPFSGNVNKIMSDDELIQAIRIDIAAEIEATYLYDAHIQSTDNELAKKVLSDIRDEEKIHIGELMTLLKRLDPKMAEQLISGESEVKEMLNEL